MKGYQLGKNIRIQSELKDEIYKQGYTVKEFAEMIDIDRLTLNNIFTHKSKPRKSTIKLISDGLHISENEVTRLCQ